MTDLAVLLFALVLAFGGAWWLLWGGGARRVARALLRVVYRVRVSGLEHLPSKGGALLVANHLSYVDVLVISVASPRPVRFLMRRDLWERPILGFVARAAGTIPLAAGEGRRAVAEALRSASEHAANGELVAIFAEGSISRSGVLLPFARGMEAIAKRAGVPIVPVALHGLWGSIFSYAGGRAFWKRPRRLPYPVRVELSAALPADTPSWRVRAAIERMLAAGPRLEPPSRRTLVERFVRTARAASDREAVVDSTGARWTYGRLLRAALAFERRLRRDLPGEERVGILLPPSAGGALANVALAMAGRASVNLNYTLGAEALREPIAKAGLRTVITSRSFLSALGENAPDLSGLNRIDLEDLASSFGGLEKLRAAALALLPGPLLARVVARTSGDTPVTVLFSSGSTSEPKGIVLSHENVLSNLEAAVQVFRFEARDRLLGVLPFFHSFGYTITLWAPLCAGARAIYHANPLDAKAIGALGAAERPTIVLATPLFYQGWLRRIEPEAFAELRLAVTGAQKLTERLARAFEKRFGVPLHEGYGCTELSPVVSCNVPAVEADGVRLEGAREGTVGRALPGVALRIVDEETDEELPPGREGALWVRGRNVMLGYLDDPERTAEVVRDGWYDTGDVARLDEDGFLVLTDRRSRFSKIGGEMVPHGLVEERLREAVLALSGTDVEDGEVALAVCGVEDERKGERLAVVHEELPVAVDDVLAEARRRGLANLFQPRPDAFVEVPELPRLGTGKLDLRGLTRLARKEAPPPRRD